MPKITAYLSIFEQKLEKIRHDIKKAEKEKKPDLERLRKEAKKLEDLVGEMKEKNRVNIECPKCGERFRTPIENVKIK